jgi:NitT/TauT family transport system substrate-binding protein
LRNTLRGLARLAFVFLLLEVPIALAQTPMKITLASPGPGSYSYFPIDLVKKIGADLAEGVDLEIRYQSGGPLAAKELVNGNCDFAALGMSALATFHADGKDVRSIVTVSRSPTYVLSVRSELRNNVRKVADLKSRVVGVHSGGRNSKSTSRQLVEYMLNQAGVAPDSVNFLPAGQNFEEQRAALLSGTIDALMGEEPFTSRLQAEGLVYVLTDLHDPKAAKQALGGPLLYVQIATRNSLLQQQPEKVKRMVAVMRRTLLWIYNHSPDEIANLLGGNDLQRKREISLFLARSKSAFSPDGMFRREEVSTVERFFRDVYSDDPKSRNLRMTDLIDARYAGWRE